MGLLGDVLKVGFDIITTPVAVVKDVVTLGGSLTDKEEPYTFEKIKELDKDIDKIGKDLVK